MEVELSLGVVPPGEALLVSDDPIEGETEGCQEEDAGQDHDQGVLQPAPAAPFVLLLVVPVCVHLVLRHGPSGFFSPKKKYDQLPKNFTLCLHVGTTCARTPRTTSESELNKMKTKRATEKKPTLLLLSLCLERDCARVSFCC
jgi:hypothetical protein